MDVFRPSFEDKRKSSRRRANLSHSSRSFDIFVLLPGNQPAQIARAMHEIQGIIGAGRRIVVTYALADGATAASTAVQLHAHAGSFALPMQTFSVEEVLKEPIEGISALVSGIRGVLVAPRPVLLVVMHQQTFGSFFALNELHAWPHWHSEYLMPAEPQHLVYWPDDMTIIVQGGPRHLRR
jgi:hypothetical protein